MQHTPQLTLRARSGLEVQMRIRVLKSKKQPSSWREGMRVASEREPRIVMYPNFLTEAECVLPSIEVEILLLRIG